MPYFLMNIKFEPRDIWIGLYWTAETKRDPSVVYEWRRFAFYLCLIPCLPIIWTTRWRQVEIP